MNIIVVFMDGNIMGIALCVKEKVAIIVGYYDRPQGKGSIPFS